MGSRRLAAVLAAGILASGCAGSISNWMVNLRNSQGDSAVERNNLVEAQKEYGLALALAPNDAHARAGLAHVLYLRAQLDFVSSKLNDAEIEVRKALTYAPDDAVTQALASEVEQARIRRDVVIANYPSYQAMGLAIGVSLRAVAASNKDIQKQLRSFSYDYNPARLTKAIAEAYSLEDELHRINLRLQAYRALVQSGVAKSQPPPESETPNLLPIP